MALKILFGWPLYIGVLVTSVSVLIFLGLSYFGVRKIEAFIGFLMATICVCFFAEMGLSPVNMGDLFLGFVPDMNSDSLFSVVAIVGME